MTAIPIKDNLGRVKHLFAVKWNCLQRCLPVNLGTISLLVPDDLENYMIYWKIIKSKVEQ